MIFWPVVVFAALLPFTGRFPLFTLGALAFDLSITAACVAILAGLGRAFARRTRFDALDWATVALAAAWLVSALATPAGTAAPLAAAWRRALGPLLFVLVRGSLDSDERRFAAGLAFAGAVAALALGASLPGAADRAIHLAVCSALFLPLARRRRGLALACTGAVIIAMLALVLLNRPPSSLAMPSGRALLGWGPGSHPALALFPGILAEGGIVGALAAVATAWFGFRAVHGMLRRRPRPPEAVATILVVAVFLLAGALVNPLNSLVGASGIWLALALLIPPFKR